MLGILSKTTPSDIGKGVGKLKPEHLTRLVRMIRDGKLSSRGAKDTLSILVREGGNLDSVTKEHGFIQDSSAAALEGVAKRVIQENPSVAADYKEGKTEVLQYLVGQGMKATRGSGNPKMLQELFIKLLH